MSSTTDKSDNTAESVKSDNSAESANSQKPSERKLADEKLNAGFSGVYGCLVFIIFIFTVESVIDFTNNDVQDVCPDSQLWSVTLFMGIIFPLLLIVSAIHAAKSKKHSVILRHIYIWICPLTASIIWAWDQLWGVPGFANDTCVYENFGTENVTCENNNKGGHNLFLAVTNWIIIYIYLLVKCGIAVVRIYQEKKKNETETRANTTDVPLATMV